jgi:hypothetical protein
MSIETYKSNYHLFSLDIINTDQKLLLMTSVVGVKFVKICKPML